MIPGVTGQFGLGVENEAQQSLTVLSREHTGHSKHTFSKNTREASTHGYHQIVNTEIRFITLIEAKDKETLSVS